MTRHPDAALDRLERDTFGYFLRETNSGNGLVPDNTRGDSPSSITAVGLGLSAYPVGVERGYLRRADAVQRVLAALRFFRDSSQDGDRHATGYKGFYQHFLEMDDGRRMIRPWSSELSTVDSTFLVAGMLAAATYFDRETGREREIRDTAEALYRRMDWNWAANQGNLVTLGWRPESGFLKPRWTGYNEALLLYVLALASPTHPLPAASYAQWARTYRFKKLYGYELLYAGPLFIHQLSHVWIDFRVIQDDVMRARGLDYFENSRRATYVQQAYAKHNPRGFLGYGENVWGITASDGPGPATLRIAGKPRRFWDYRARGVPFGPDDGTVAPWAAIASMPFAPDIVLPAIDYWRHAYPDMESKYGFKCSFNPTFPRETGGPSGWISKGYYGLDQGPIVLMIENYRTGFFWELMRRCPHIERGLEKAGFTGGWLQGGTPKRDESQPAATPAG